MLGMRYVGAFFPADSFVATSFLVDCIFKKCGIFVACHFHGAVVPLVLKLHCRGTAGGSGRGFVSIDVLDPRP